jgi:hypothetical protein
MSTWLGSRAAEWMGGGAPPALAKLRFPLVLAPYEGRPWFLPIVGEYFRMKDRRAARSVPPPGASAAEPGADGS